jgi:hypothetical protein
MQQIFWTYLQRAIVQAVGQTGAIGYIGLAYETKEVKQLAYLMIKEKLYWAICSECKIKRIQLLDHYFTCSTRKMLQK